MMNLTFGEQVKIILSRKGMTIKQLAEEVEKYTGKPMSRQNMTQRLGRDNFQEQDMRMIADILGCTFTLSIMGPEVVKPEAEDHETRDITIGELVESVIEEPMTEEVAEPTQGDVVEPVEEELVVSQEDTRERDILRQGIKGYFRKGSLETGASANIKEEQTVGEINPYTRKEYETNSVRMHPKKIGYVQVYDREQHKWTDMTEWAFLGYQERKKQLLGKDYRPPIYLD
ncbi:MAG: hypothetical protein IJA54_04610 [Tyzzerella sp.]|nr:hypothetical protein [Tyzzerella sp.]